MRLDETSDNLLRVMKICFALMMAAELALGIGCGDADSSEPIGKKPEVQEELQWSDHVKRVYGHNECVRAC